LKKREATFALIAIYGSLLVLLLVSSAVSVGASSVWSKTYGGAGFDGALSLIQTADGGYCLAGYTSSFGAGEEDVWLLKVDGSGDMQWNRTYGGEEADFAFSVIATSDGGYAVAGYTGSFGAGGDDFWLIKTDSRGNTEWNQTYGGADDDYAFCLVKASDGGYTIAGYTRSYGAGRDDFWLVKTDPSGNAEWNRTYGGWDDDGAISLVHCSDGGYALAGMTESFGYGSDRDDFWLVKTDSSGNMEWNQTYGGIIREYGFCLVETSDGGYAFAGSTCTFGAGNHDSWLVKTDSFGNVEWNQTYGGADVDGTTSLVQTSDGGYALSGSTKSFGLGEEDFWLIKTDASGNAEWNQTYGKAADDISSSLVLTADGGYAIAGYTYSIDAGNSDAWLIKTDEHGYIPEFPTWIIVPLFLIVSLCAVVIRKKTLHQIS
jgi:predicted secreted protein